MRFRPAVIDDLRTLVDIQEEGAILAIGHIFPQDAYPFPRAEVVGRWTAEVTDPATNVYVSTGARGSITGFAATRGDELLHFGTAATTWGSGLATALHDAVLDTFEETTDIVRLVVFEQNLRARRFYEKEGWRATGDRTVSAYPPYPVLLEYTRSI